MSTACTIGPWEATGLAAAGISYRVLGDLGLYERRVVRDALAYLRVAVNPRDREGFSRAAAAPRRGIGAAALAVLIKEAERTGATLVECARGAEALSGLAAPARAALSRLGGELAGLCALAAAAGPGRLLEQALLLPGGLVSHLRARADDDPGGSPISSACASFCAPRAPSSSARRRRTPGTS